MFTANLDLKVDPENWNLLGGPAEVFKLGIDSGLLIIVYANCGLLLYQNSPATVC